MKKASTPVVAAAAGKREKAIVFCRACGYSCKGRIRLKCDKHPRVSYLLDIAECPRCNSSDFLDEFYDS